VLQTIVDMAEIRDYDASDVFKYSHFATELVDVLFKQLITFH